jgi:hypothetical protein
VYIRRPSPLDSSITSTLIYYTIYNVFHYHPSQPITLVSFRQDYLLPY